MDIENIKELHNLIINLQKYNKLLETFEILNTKTKELSEENILLKNKIKELELNLNNQKDEDFKNYNKVSVIQLMDKQLSDKTSYINILENQLKFYKNEINKYQKKYSNEKIDDKLNGKLDNKLDDKLNENLDDKLNNKLNEKIDDKLNGKLDDKLDNKLNENLDDKLNNKLNEKIDDKLNEKIDNKLDNVNDYILIKYKKNVYYINNITNKVYSVKNDNPYKYIGNKINDKIIFI